MLEWCPKISKIGGIPNISYEPCKSVPLGTMLKNGDECIRAVVAFQDIVQGHEKQQEKCYSGEQIFFSSENIIPSHKYEVLPWVEG